MKVCVIGAGYVGLTSAAVLAALGHDVICVDNNKDKIDMLENGKIPIYEPGLESLIIKNKNRLQFSYNRKETITNSAIILIAVGTPSLEDGSTDLTYINSVIHDLTQTTKSYKTIITKSTVPPGTNEYIKNNLIKNGVSPSLFNIISNPEFLREGSAVADMFSPDKTVIGIEKDDDQSIKVMKELYKGIHAPFIVTTLNGAEILKYASNAFLATKISFINEMARICDKYNADVTEIAKGIGLDPRIGSHFLQAGLGYGGSCFPKDVRSLIHTAMSENIETFILQAVQSVNHTQVKHYVEKMKSNIPDLSAKKVTVLGIAFKPNTDDIRYSPAIELIKELTKLGCDVHAYDPKATLPVIYSGKVIQHHDLVESIQGTDCVVIGTDWDECKRLNWEDVKKSMNGNFIVDGRNCIDPREIEKYGLLYIGVGRI